MDQSKFRSTGDVDDRRNENHHRPMQSQPGYPRGEVRWNEMGHDLGLTGIENEIHDNDQQLRQSSLGTELGRGDIDDTRGRARRVADGEDSGEESGEVASYAGGGAIPDDDEEALGSNAGVQDDTTTDLNGALQTVQQALMFGRQKHGLPGGGGSGDNSEPAPQEQAGIPEDDGGESYSEGGTIEDDIYASNNATDDGPQYGRPEVVDDPDAVSPPISGDNLDMSGYAGNESAGLRTGNDVSGDESGAMPAVSPVNDESGAGPAVGRPGLQPEGAVGAFGREAANAAGFGARRPGGIPDEYLPHNMMRNGVQSIIGYLQGKGAMPNEQALALEQSVAPQAKNDPAAVPVLATAAAGDPEQQFAYIQRNRQVYDATMAHGRAALSGVEGRPPSLDVALQDANKAFATVPDGENVHFVKHGDGVVARVSGASGREQRGYPMSLEQFGQLLDTGNAGMFDRMMAPGGVRRVLGGFGSQEPQGDGAASNPYLQRRMEQGGQQVGGGSGPIRPYGGTLNQPEVGGDKEATREMWGENPKQPGGGLDRDVTLIRTPGYQQMQGDQGNRRIVDRRGYTTGHQSIPGTSDGQNQVRLIGAGTEDRTFKGGAETTPTEQDKKLALIRAKNEGRGTIDDKLAVEDRRIDGRLRVEQARTEQKGRHEDRLDARSAANRESREKIHAGQVDARLKQIAAGSQNQHERTMAADIRTIRMNGGKLNPAQEQFIARVNQQLTQQPQQQSAAPQAQSPQAQAAIAWANANPNDPRAAKIKQLHGAQ